MGATPRHLGPEPESWTFSLTKTTSSWLMASVRVFLCVRPVSKHIRTMIHPAWKLSHSLIQWSWVQTVLIVPHLLNNFRIKRIIQLITILKASFSNDLVRQSKVAELNYSNNHFTGELCSAYEDQLQKAHSWCKMQMYW